MPGKKPTEMMNIAREDAASPRLADLLCIARRHVIDGKRAIAEQRERIEARRREGHECAGAESRLAQLETTMQSMQDHVAHEEELV